MVNSPPCSNAVAWGDADGARKGNRMIEELVEPDETGGWRLSAIGHEMAQDLAKGGEVKSAVANFLLWREIKNLRLKWQETNRGKGGER